MVQGVTRRPWVQPTLNVYNGQIVNPHEPQKGGSRFSSFLNYLYIDLIDLIEIKCIDFT